MKKTELTKIIKEVLTEESLAETTSALKKHLTAARGLAARSYRQAELNPDQANPTLGNEIAEMLKAVYNALSTGNGDDDTYADEIFK